MTKGISLPSLLCVLALGVGFAAGYAAAPKFSDPVAETPALVEALQEDNLLNRSLKLGQFLQTLGPDNLDESLVTLRENRVGVSDQELQVFMLAWGRFDPAGAFRWARAQEADWRSRLEKAATYAWGFIDPHSALQTLKSVPSKGVGKAGATLDNDLVAGWRVNGDVAGLTAYLISLPASRERESMTTHLLAQIGKGGPEAVIAWADAIPEDANGGFKRVAFNRAAGVVAHANDRLAAEWYERHRGRKYTERALPVIARRWIDYHEPTELLGWLAGLPPLPGQTSDPEQIRAIGQGMKWWLRRDPSAAGEWLNSMVVIPWVYDPALASMAQYQLKQSPEIAVYWAGRIQGDTLRSETLIKSVGRWRRRDREAAEKWLAEAEISEELRASILAAKEKPRTRRTRGAKPD
ncbi:MAG: hypothetical protein OSB70_02295 [Myxococcota bacterium]|nr:hypothetical protein [Myxococcota bacterium]